MIKGKTKKKLLEELGKTGNVSVSCLRAGISRATFYRLVKKSSEFSEAAEKAEFLGRENMIDTVEWALIKKASGGDSRLMEFYLSHNSKRYRSIPKNEKNYDPLPPIKIKVLRPGEPPDNNDNDEDEYEYCTE